jgi:ubiquinone/menaquinone biosynthesis C-methylase UbiE
MTRDKIKKFYSHAMEADRLETEGFKLEGIRTKEIIKRYAAGTNLEILDIGGGAGYYSFWLQENGHQVTLVDLSPANIELVRKKSQTSGIALKAVEVGDAVDLSFSDQQFDMVLLFGPMYHLIDRKERIEALSEARRVLKRKGKLLIALISRYASLIDGFQRDLIKDDRFFNLLMHDLKTGIHLNETDNLEYFTEAYFHTTNEIKAEIAESGLVLEQLIPVESFGWMVKDFLAKEKDQVYMRKLLETIRTVETMEDLLPISPHLIAVSTRE